MIQTFKSGNDRIGTMIRGSGHEILHDFIAIGAALAQLDVNQATKATLLDAFITAFEEMTAEMEEEKNGSRKQAQQNRCAA